MTDFISIPYYCEENIWTLFHMCQFSARDTHAVFISNRQKTVACHHQKNSLCQEVVIWDYHVIALERPNRTWNIWDFNTDLGTPCPALLWAQSTFGSPLIHPDYQPYFKLVPKRIFLETFCSDRLHMKNRDGSFKESPPPWKCIGDGKSNLETFCDMGENPNYTVLSLERFIRLIDSKNLIETTYD